MIIIIIIIIMQITDGNGFFWFESSLHSRVLNTNWCETCIYEKTVDIDKQTEKIIDDQAFGLFKKAKSALS